MTISKVLNVVKFIDHCIKKETPYKAADIAERLGITERQVFNYLKAMRSEGFPIAYCRKTHKYYYTKTGKFFFGFLEKESQN